MGALAPTRYTGGRGAGSGYPPGGSNDDRFFPPKGRPEAEILAYRDRRLINPWSLYRNQHMARIGLAMWYGLGRQWSEIDYSAAFDGFRGAVLRELDDDDVNPVRPVTNEIDPLVDDELVSLVKRRWAPKAIPSSNDPEIKAAAQVATDWLNYRLEQLGWNQKRYNLGLHFALGGTGLIYTACDRSYYDLKPMSAPSAVWCSDGHKFYSARVPVDTYRAGFTEPGVGRYPALHSETVRSAGPDTGEVEMTYCPQCEQRNRLVPYEEMTPEEASSGVDPFGRPLGVDGPRHNTTIDIDLPWEFYPQDGGFRVQPKELRRFGRRKIRSLEWIEERYPDLVHLVAPDSVTELLHGDPLMGNWDTLGSWSGVFDGGILDFHANVDEMIELPTFRSPLGRYVVATRDVVLEDSDLLEAVDIDDHGEPRTVYVERGKIHIARFKLRPGELWGTTIADNQIPKQNRLNGLDAQVIGARLRLGSPNIALPEDGWPDDGPQQLDSWGEGRVILTRPSLSTPEWDGKPEVIGGTLFPDDVYQERDRIQNDIRRTSRTSAAAGGNNPAGVRNSSQLQMLIEEDSRSRSVREDELVAAGEDACSHITRLEWLLRDDEDVYKVLGPNKTWKVQQYRGAAFRGQTEIKIEKGAFISPSTVQREAAREGIADGIVEINGPVVRRRLRELYGLDADLNDDLNNQVDHAERIWIDFLQNKRVRVQDSIDDPAIHFVVLMTHLRTDEGEQLAEGARVGQLIGWDEIQRKIALWRDELATVEKLEQDAIAFYGKRLIGDEAAEAFAKAMIQYQQEQTLFQQQQAVYQAQITENANAPVGAMAPPAMVAPQPPMRPPQPVQLPLLKQDRIMVVMLDMLQRQGVEIPPDPLIVPEGDDPLLYVRFRALVAAYDLSAAAISLPAAGVGATLPAAGAAPSPAPASVPGAPGGAPGGVPPVPSTAPMPEGGKH